METTCNIWLDNSGPKHKFDGFFVSFKKIGGVLKIYKFRRFISKILLADFQPYVESGFPLLKLTN